MEVNAFFGFQESPFSTAPDLRFLFLTPQHQSLLEALGAYILEPHGVALLTGEPGVGKTLLTQALVQNLPETVKPVWISRPGEEPLAVPLQIARFLGLELRERNLVSINRLEEALGHIAGQGVRLLVVVDDAHLLRDQHLEEIYLLSQMEDQGRQLLGLLLIGRRALQHKLASKVNQRLLGVIHPHLELGPLSFEETKLYVDHRLKAAGSGLPEVFADGCAARIYALTGGIPGRINQVCHQALVRACRENRPRVSRDLLGEGEPRPEYQPLTPLPEERRWPRVALGFIAALALLTGAYLGYQYLPGLVSPWLSSPRETPGESGRPVQISELKDQEAPEPKAPSPSAAGPPPEAKTAGEGELPRRGGSEGASPTGSPAAELHQVSAADGGLLKIVAQRYQERKGWGYEAVILANEDIKNEDLLYAGQILVLPPVDQESGIITLPRSQHYLFLKNLSDISEARKMLARLKDLKLNVTLRETTLRGQTRNYRIYLGPYETKEELLRAKALAAQHF